MVYSKSFVFYYFRKYDLCQLRERKILQIIPRIQFITILYFGMKTIMVKKYKFYLECSEFEFKFSIYVYGMLYLKLILRKNLLQRYIFRNWEYYEYFYFMLKPFGCLTFSEILNPI